MEYIAKKVGDRFELYCIQTMQGIDYQPVNVIQLIDTSTEAELLAQLENYSLQMEDINKKLQAINTVKNG